jgi:hypothetical protein
MPGLVPGIHEAKKRNVDRGHEAGHDDYGVAPAPSAHYLWPQSAIALYTIERDHDSRFRLAQPEAIVILPPGKCPCPTVIA